MSKLSHVFKERHTMMGVFYPIHYLVAVFPDAAVAAKVRGNLLAAGFSPDEAIVCEGQDFVDLEKEETGLAQYMMQELSRFLATEQISTDHNRDFAEEGAGFVLVHCPSEFLKNKAWRIMEADNPLTAHYYDRLGVDHLAGGFSTD